METFRYKPLGVQVADHLREQLQRGTWQGEMPGAPALSAKLGVNHRAIISAFALLEKEGLLVSQGSGRRRIITSPARHSHPTLRIRILLYEENDRCRFHMVELHHRLLEMNHDVGYAGKTLQELDMDLKKVIRYVKKVDADAWVIASGSREILEWFSSQATPAFALAGRRRDIHIAGCGPDKAPALRQAVQRLAGLGHRRIVLITREERRKPGPGLLERSFLEELEQQGIPTGPYNLPDWSNDIADFHRCLDSLFQHTPPTALLIDEYEPYVAAQSHLSQRGILAPRDVSLLCTDPSPAFDWCRPIATHITWNSEQMVRPVLQWADHVASGRGDCRQYFIKARLIEGETIGPPP